MSKAIDKNTEGKAYSEHKRRKKYVRPELIKKDKLVEISGVTQVTV